MAVSKTFTEPTDADKLATLARFIRSTSHVLNYGGGMSMARIPYGILVVQGPVYTL